jgi:hypothetical protein
MSEALKELLNNLSLRANEGDVLESIRGILTASETDWHVSALIYHLLKVPCKLRHEAGRKVEV